MTGQIHMPFTVPNVGSGYTPGQGSNSSIICKQFSTSFTSQASENITHNIDITIPEYKPISVYWWSIDGTGYNEWQIAILHQYVDVGNNKDMLAQTLRHQGTNNRTISFVVWVTYVKEAFFT